MNEITLQFGPDAGLVGTLATPPGNAGQPLYAVLLFNAGIVPRIGPNRLNVRMARKLAVNGIPTLRFDLSGRGDSAPARGMESFEQQAVADLRAAMDLMTQRTGAQRFLLMGICSGAENAYHTALADERVIAISLMDSYHFPTLRTHFNRYRLRAQHRGGLVKASLGWLRHRIHSSLAQNRPERVPAPATSFGSIRPSAQEFAAKLQLLLKRGVAIDLLFSGSFVETYNYAHQFRDGFERYGIVPAIHVEYRADFDHTLSTASMQKEMVARTCAWIGEVIKKKQSGSAGSRTATADLAMNVMGAIQH